MGTTGRLLPRLQQHYSLQRARVSAADVQNKRSHAKALETYRQHLQRGKTKTNAASHQLGEPSRNARAQAGAVGTLQPQTEVHLQPISAHSSMPGKGSLYGTHKCIGIMQRGTVGPQCHIPGEEARAPQGDVVDFTQGQDDLSRPRRTGMEQPECRFPLPHRQTQERDALLGKAARRALVMADIQRKSLFFFLSWAICSRRCKRAHLSFFFLVTLQR